MDRKVIRAIGVWIIAIVLAPVVLAVIAVLCGAVFGSIAVLLTKIV